MPLSLEPALPRLVGSLAVQDFNRGDQALGVASVESQVNAESLQCQAYDDP